MDNQSKNEQPKMKGQSGGGTLGGCALQVLGGIIFISLIATNFVAGFIILLIFCILGGVIICAGDKKVKESNDYQLTNYLQKEYQNNRFTATIKKEYSFELRTATFAVDENSRKIAISGFHAYNMAVQFYDFSSLLECEIIEDGATIASGGVGRAVVGGILAGGVGAIVGASTRNSKNVCNSLAVRIVTNNISNSLILLNLITTETTKDSAFYTSAHKFSQEIYALVCSIMSTNSIPATTSENKAELMNSLQQLADLKDKGIITEAEFSTKKQELLSRM